MNSIGVQTDLLHCDEVAEMEQYHSVIETTVVSSHLGDYRVDESTSPSLPMTILSLVPRARSSLALNTPAFVEISKGNWGKLRIETGLALKAECDAAVRHHSSSSESSDDGSDASTIPCKSPCCCPSSDISFKPESFFCNSDPWRPPSSLSDFSDCQDLGEWL